MREVSSLVSASLYSRRLSDGSGPMIANKQGTKPLRPRTNTVKVSQFDTGVWYGFPSQTDRKPF